MTRENAFSVTVRLLQEIKKLNCAVFMAECLEEAFGENDIISYCGDQDAINQVDAVISVGGDEIGRAHV